MKSSRKPTRSSVPEPPSPTYPQAYVRERANKGPDRYVPKPPTPKKRPR